MPAPFVSVTASTLAPSESVPKDARAAVAAWAPARERLMPSAVQAIPNSAFFMIAPQFLLLNIQANETAHKPSALL
jgi:hypothetical protein